MPGLLKITGTIDLAQFWPQGSADADTSKIKVTVGTNSFAYAIDKKKFKPTHVFDTAKVIGTKTGPLIDSKSQIIVRLQGIDAPELHYHAAPLKNPKPPAPAVPAATRAAYNAANHPDKRQWLAETATIALATKLANYPGAPLLKCQVLSLVDHPDEVIDTYGRFVGNLMVGAKFNTDVNVWLTAEGWVYPTFYSSMENDEIETLLKAMAKGKKKGRVWTAYTNNCSVFDPNLLYRKNGVPVTEKQDTGPIVMPKLYRRQVAHFARKKAGLFKGSFAKYVASLQEGCYELDDYMKNGRNAAKTRTVDEFFKGNKFHVGPEGLVFREAPARVLSKDGKPLKDF